LTLVSPPHPTRGLGSVVSFPSRIWGGQPQPRADLEPFDLEIWHLML